MRVGAIILAAGGSSRMGKPKQLLPYRGRPLIRHAVEQTLESACDCVFVVLGANASRIAEALEKPLPQGRGSELSIEVRTEPRASASDIVILCMNDRWQEGMGTSVRTGVEAAISHQLDAVIIALGDQPLISPMVLNTLISIHKETGKPVVASRYAGVAGVPALFAKELFPELLQLPPSSGCKGLIEDHASQCVLIDCPEGELDIDTPDDYARANPHHL